MIVWLSSNQSNIRYGAHYRTQHLTQVNARRCYQVLTHTLARRMYGLFKIILFWVALVPCMAFAQSDSRIALSSETQSIYLGDSVVLDIESVGLLEPLQIEKLTDLPEFLRETTGTRIAVFGGKVVEINIRRMEFIPTSIGTLILGPLYGESTTGQVTSNTISINVQAAPVNQWLPSETDLQSSITFSKTQPVVGEQVLVDIKLKHSVQIANESIQLPTFNDFDVIPIIEQRRTIEDDERWRQIHWRYLLHPKRSGTIAIGPLLWNGTLIKSRTQRAEFNHSPTETTLTVEPAPADRPEWWLPASSVKLSDAWSKEVTTLSAGDEIFRTITLTATNVLGSQLPDIAPLPTRALTSTLVRTTRNHELVNEHTVATATFEYRLVAQSPIPVFLDTVRVLWWDTQASNHREAILPARRINVGLPDRADLLADLATNKSTWSSLLLQLRAYAKWQSIIAAILIVATVILLLPLIIDGIRLFRTEHRNRKTLKKLEQLRLSGQWQALYNALDQSGRDHAAHRTSGVNAMADNGTTRPFTANGQLDTNSKEFCALLTALQKKLFSDTHAEPSAVLQLKIDLPFISAKVDGTHSSIARL